MNLEDYAPRLLMIDDDEIMVGTVCKFMRTAGFEVSWCLDGEDGIRKATDELPDLIILDIMMPGMSGLEVMQEIRTDARTRDIPILFLTSLDDEATVVKGLKGAEDYMVKPFRTLEFEARVRKILDRKPGEGGGARRGSPSAGRLAVTIGTETYLLPFEQICFVEAHGKYTYVGTRNRRVLTGYSIGDLEQRLPSSEFLRIHRSCMVNLGHVHKAVRKPPGKVALAMDDEAHTELVVSDTYLPEVKKRLDL